MTAQSFDTFCQRCLILIEAHVIASGQASPGVDGSSFLGNDLEWRDGYLHIALCPRCKSPFLVHEICFGLRGQPASQSVNIVLFPSETRLPLENVPVNLMSSYEQASQCFKIQCFDASAMMSRRTLEGICKALGATGRTLNDKLIKLHDSGKIDKMLLKWADGVRVVGNDAAHEIEMNLSQEDARDALDFTEAILLYVFALSNRFARFQERHPEKKPLP